MNIRICNFHTVIRKYCMDRMKWLRNNRIIAQRNALGIYDETKDMTEEQTIGEIYHKIRGLSREEAAELENNTELRKACCSIHIDILEIILQNLERQEPEQYEALDEIKNAAINLVQASRINENRNYFGWSQEEKKTITEEEINQLVSYIKTIDDNSLEEVQHLFYRRVLTKEEEREIIKKLQDNWLETTKHLYCESTNEIACFYSHEFEETVDRNKIIDLLKDKGETRIYEINSCDLDAVSYIMDTEALLMNQKSQAYWCSEGMDWAIIKDHEGFYFVCGAFLVEACKRVTEAGK